MKIAIATPTWIRTAEEGKVVFSTLNVLSKLDLPIVVVDGGSPKHEQDRIRVIPNVHFFGEQGSFSDRLVKAITQAGRVANNIFYLQSDKLDFAKHSALQLIQAYKSLKEPSMLVASRTQSTMLKYPSFQQKQEAFLNFFVGDFVGIQEDYFAGPKLFPSSLTSYLKNIQGDIGWGIEAYLYVVATRIGLPFHFFPIDMKPPADIGNDKEIKKSRLEVTQSIIEGFLQAQRLGFS